MKGLSSLAAAAVALLPSHAALADASSRGGVTLETRAFVPDEDETTEDLGIAVSSQMEVKFQAKPFSVVLRGFARLDAIDDTRNIVDLQEGYVGFTTDRFTLRIGSQIINWTATEAFHPADILNSRNLDSDIENQEKLGEPMVEFRLRVLKGEIGAYFMPVRIAPKVPVEGSRLAVIPGGLVVGDVLWVDRNGKPTEERFTPQAAAHVTQTIGPADVSLHVVDYSDRHTPTFTQDTESGDIRATLHSVTQFGLTYVHVVGPLIMKVEAAKRIFRPVAEDTGEFDIDEVPDHEKAAVGLEYGWTTSAGHDATLVAEGQAVFESPRDERKDLDVFQGDVLVGYRHQFNDVNARELFLAFIADVETPNEYVAALRYSQRITDVWSVAGSAHSLRLFERAIQEGSLLLTRNF